MASGPSSFDGYFVPNKIEHQAIGDRSNLIPIRMDWSMYSQVLPGSTNGTDLRL